MLLPKSYHILLASISYVSFLNMLFYFALLPNKRSSEELEELNACLGGCTFPEIQNDIKQALQSNPHQIIKYFARTFVKYCNLPLKLVMGLYSWVMKVA
jgi:hypothetical protein